MIDNDLENRIVAAMNSQFKKFNLKITGNVCTANYIHPGDLLKRSQMPLSEFISNEYKILIYLGFTDDELFSLIFSCNDG